MIFTISSRIAGSAFTVFIFSTSSEVNLSAICLLPEEAARKFTAEVAQETRDSFKELGLLK
jgi:hypothetical protein